MIDWIIEHQVGVMVYIAIHVMTYIGVIHILSKPHLKNAKNPLPAVTDRLHPFARIDTENWSIIKCFPFYIFFWPRLFAGLANVLFYTTWVWVFMLGVDLKNPKIGSIRLFMIKRMGQFCNRLHCLFGGLLWYDVEYVETGEGDYSKWLGPDWKPEWSGAGTIISNHVSYMDILICLVIFFPSFTAKSSVKGYPGVGQIATAIDCLFTERQGSKEDKEAVLRQVSERQRQNEEEGRSPMMMYPEGATTNNRQLIKFKRGAFYTMRSVQPMCLKYDSLNGISVQNDTLFQYHYFYSFMSCCTTCHIKVYPVFKPNQYFIDNFCKDQSDENWKVYMSTVREQIMAKSFNFNLSDVAMEDKFEFKALIQGKDTVSLKKKKDD